MQFLKIISTECIPGYPDRNLPTTLLYHAGACAKHLVGLAMFGGLHATPESVALVLNNFGPVCSSESEAKPGEGGGEGEGSGADAGRGARVAAAADALKRSVLESLLEAAGGRDADND